MTAEEKGVGFPRSNPGPARALWAKRGAFIVDATLVPARQKIPTDRRPARTFESLIFFLTSLKWKKNEIYS